MSLPYLRPASRRSDESPSLQRVRSSADGTSSPILPRRHDGVPLSPQVPSTVASLSSTTWGVRALSSIGSSGVQRDLWLPSRTVDDADSTQSVEATFEMIARFAGGASGETWVVRCRGMTPHVSALHGFTSHNGAALVSSPCHSPLNSAHSSTPKREDRVSVHIVSFVRPVRRFIPENLDSSGFSPGGDPDGSHNVGGSAVRSIRELRRERGLSTVSSNGRSAPSVVMSGGNLSISSSLDRVPLSAMLGAATPNDMLMLFDDSAVQRHAAMADEEMRPDAPAHSSGAVTVPKRPSHVAPDAEGSLFAMKILFLDRKGPEKRDQLRQRAEQEIECLRKSQCPLVVSYISHKFTENTCELVMQLVDGGDLEMQIKKRLRVAHEERRPAETYSEEEALFYFVQACVAARSLHRRNILHRDIKSGNFLCSSNGLLKLADFGFSKDFSPHGVVGRTVCSDYLGTPAFMAPEIWRGDAYGDKAEVWSLGIVLYQLLTLEFPFNGSTSASLSRRICRGTYLPTNAARQHGGVVKVSEETQDMIHWMLSVDQTQRPTLDELLASRVMRHAQERFITFYNHVI